MSSPKWWQRGAIYQIYPRSFADSNGDGVGDLAGITAHLDHLAALKVEAIWLSPIFPSPMADFGYDVSDYCDVDPVFGTLADLDELIAACHAREIKLVLDWVPNHSSDQHPWFMESRSSRESPKRDWYIWRDGKDGGPPNDWDSVFTAVGPAWTYDEATGQWYLHSFMREQPDLNWENPEVVAAMHDVLRFWMDRGVDGLRLDAIAKIAKDPLLRDHKHAARRHDEDWESIHGYLRGIRKVIDEYDDRMIVGEVALQDLHRIVGYLESGDQLHLAHNFVFIDQDWDAEAYATSVADFEALADETAWPAWFLANHDKPRPASALRPRRARRAAGPRDPADDLHAARHPVRLPGRGAGPARRADPARAGGRRRRPRPRARADPVDAGRARPRVHDRGPVAAVRHRRGHAQRADAGPGPALDALPHARDRAPARAKPPRC